jgi:hypothetical protein
MKVLIAKWPEGSNGWQYTMHFVKGVDVTSCFMAIDETGDPCQTKYKIFGLNKLFAIDSEDSIRDLYSSEKVKENDFSEVSLEKIYAS